jgi:hypothetical protein
VLSRDDIGIHLTCELVVDGATWPCLSHTIEHPDGLVLVDTGMIESTPELDELFHPTVHPLPDEIVQRVADTPGKRLVLELAAPTYLAHVREPHAPHPNV